MNKDLNFSASSLYFATLFIILIVACNQSSILDKTHKFRNASWPVEVIPEFQWKIIDTSPNYNIFLKIQHNTELQFQNVYVKFLTRFPDSTTKEQVLSLELFQPNGVPFGNCSGSDCETEIPLIEQTKFQFTGDYGLRIELFGRDTILHGIESIALCVNKNLK